MSDNKKEHAPIEDDYDMADTLWKFARPVFELFEDAEDAIDIATLAWNAAILKNDDWKEMVESVGKENNLSDEEIEEDNKLVVELIKRKEVEFPDNDRVIVDFDYSEDEEGGSLGVSWAFPHELERESEQ